MRHFAAHEFLETQEALRSKSAEIELFGVLIQMTTDSQLRDLLQNQQRRTMYDFQQGLSLLSGRGINMQQSQSPQMNVYQNIQIGIQQQPQPMTPNPTTSLMSDASIANHVLFLRKAGSVFSMVWASECADPQVRTFHVACGNTCQQMAYEIWQYLNARGYYQPAELSDKTMAVMRQEFASPTQSTMPYSQVR